MPVKAVFRSPQQSSTTLLKLIFAVFLTALNGVPVFSQGELSKYISEISAGGQPYYSSDAYSYFIRKGFQLPVQQPREEAVIAFKAAIRLAEMGTGARDAIPVLVNAFPRAVHVTEVNNIRYGGEGTFEDWVQTYVTGEKTKLLLSSVFLDYASISKCEDFIVCTYEITRMNGETVTIPTKDPVNISVTHTVYFGAYALATISGEQFGTDLEKWRGWWNAGPTSFNSAIPSPVADAAVARQSGSLRSGQLFGDIVLHGTYRMYLSTGDNLEGRIEAKDDTSLILETSEGKAYTFKPSIITKYDYLEPPRAPSNSSKNSANLDTVPFSFEELGSKQLTGKTLEVRISSGTVFRGVLEFVDGESLKLAVENSSIPIDRTVIVNIRVVPVQSPPAEPPRKQTSGASAKRDTVIVKNPQTDDWGKPKPDFVYSGTITSDASGQICIATDTEGEKKISRSQVLRVVRNSVEGYEAVIKRYAAPLFCPDDMFIVDMPPGKQGRPFFKVCVDRYEYPNVNGTVPKVNVSYDQAKALCEKKGKRLCTAEEWQWACGGLEGYTYPYGWNPEDEKCNADDNRAPEASGSRYNCVGKFGGFDMVGNVFEWVTGPRRQPAIMGGPLSKCQTITEGLGGGAKPRSGFRCCKSN